MKTAGGLARDGGMAEVETVVWILFPPSCLEVYLHTHATAHTIHCRISEQYLEIGLSKQKRDHRDMVTHLSILRTILRSVVMGNFGTSPTVLL